MYILHYLTFVFLQLIICSKAQQAEGAMPTLVVTTFTLFNTTSTTSTLMPTSTSNITSENNSNNTLSIFHSPSPTSFVFTHFPFPMHTGSSSSMMSSARPSQSAPLPDDTIGKNGRLHISGASLVHPAAVGYLVSIAIYFLT